MCQLDQGTPGALGKEETTPELRLREQLGPAAGCCSTTHTILFLASGAPVKFLPLELSPAAVPIFLPVDHTDKISFERHNPTFIISVPEGQAGGIQTTNPMSSHIQYTACDLEALDFRSYSLMS